MNWVISNMDNTRIKELHIGNILKIKKLQEFIKKDDLNLKAEIKDAETKDAIKVQLFVLIGRKRQEPDWDEWKKNKLGITINGPLRYILFMIDAVKNDKVTIAKPTMFQESRILGPQTLVWIVFEGFETSRNTFLHSVVDWGHPCCYLSNHLELAECVEVKVEKLRKQLGIDKEEEEEELNYKAFKKYVEDRSLKTNDSGNQLFGALKFDYNGPELGEKEEIVKRSKQSYDGHTIPEIFIKMYDYYKKKSNLHLKYSCTWHEQKFPNQDY
ncbi:hypothetical protein H8356DRAFT_1364743 [Neocallimastix lanati (nom. inval.)]|nr:hypothetical protein H8356DRAFT_1364743 [Neocallimastix sp. JGI-2020a]